MSGNKKKISKRYVVCINNAGSEASLERNKIYVVLTDRKVEADGLVRVVDEDGEDYLYPADWFAAVEVSKAIQVSLRAAP
jgi:archaellum component FlaG (FlaF/FlaG flagellin family)